MTDLGGDLDFSDEVHPSRAVTEPVAARVAALVERP